MFQIAVSYEVISIKEFALLFINFFTSKQTWIVILCALVNSQEVPDAEPPLVGIAYPAFAACTAANRNAIFCNIQGVDNCQSTETVVSTWQ